MITQRVIFGLLLIPSLAWMKLVFSFGTGLAYPADVLTVAQMTSVKDIINFYGYPAEEHKIKTEDGYILGLQRIPKIGGQPVLLMHGLRSSGIAWIMMGPWSGLAYLLHDRGYDVWIANSRGTRFGQQHIQLESSHPKFWNFSLHEIGVYDTSAAIDFVLQKTNYKQLSYIGHSQGSAAIYILLSQRPKYNEKISIIHAVAPAVFMHNLRSQFKTLAQYYLESFRYPYYGSTADINYNNFCHSNLFVRDLCIRTFLGFFGPSLPGALNMTMTKVLLSHYPEACSIRQIAHYYQIHRSDVFAPFYYDFLHREYVRTEPYPLGKVTVPNAIYYCGNDYVVDKNDVRKLERSLPLVIFTKFEENCNHLDPIISTMARETFYNDLLSVNEKILNKNMKNNFY